MPNGIKINTENDDSDDDTPADQNVALRFNKKYCKVKPSVPQKSSI